ncbi:hypothetical protein Aperf_G00000117967 [Anoplocephala perfoliata]
MALQKFHRPSLESQEDDDVIKMREHRFMACHGDCQRIYTLTSCQQVENTTVFTFRSINVTLGFAELGVYMVFQVLDQAIWQGFLNSEPETGGFNMIASGVFYFPVVFTFATACGLGYMALNMSYGQIMLPKYMEDLGLMAYPVANFLFGAFGTVLLNVTLLCSMIVVTSSEVVSISSIFICDVYMTYISELKSCNIDTTAYVKRATSVVHYDSHLCICFFEFELYRVVNPTYDSRKCLN